MRVQTALSLFAPMLVLPLISTHPAAGQDPAQVSIEIAPVAEGVYVITGQGGNIGLSVGADGAFLVDDQYAPLTERILAAIATVTDQPVRFVVNTHFHDDHTNGNENLGEAGAIIVAHERVRERLTTEQFIEFFGARMPPAPAAALPVVTFNDRVTFHWNGQDIRAIHVERAHTDGDVIVHFRGPNALHMGDTYFNGMYPFIDVGNGGTIDGLIAAADRALEVSDAGTRIIPGHGAVSGRAELQEYRNMLVTVRDRIQALIAEGRTAEGIVAAKPTADLDAKWGVAFINGDQFTTMVHAGMMGR